MDFPYPSAPASVPAEFTRPTPAYQRHVAAAVAALAAFALLYLGMAWWFAHTAWVLIQTARGGEAFWAWFAAIPALFLFAFLLKGLFFLKREGPDTSDEVKREDEPKLFAFIDRLADEVGAPRPHRVFLTNRVNAAVFYDVSFWNLIFPSRKNLEIGLGLVNVLTLDEFKAVLAHELGHFAQRSMTVGTWVYTGGRAISAVVSRRDAFDGFLNGLSRFDLRIAWVGWLLRIVVWSLRAVLDTAFRLLTLAERALSREMEFQADLVAASVTGSDSLLHALRRLGPADDALGRAMGFSVGQAHDGEGRVADLFEVQTRMLGHLRRVMGDPHLGSVPPLLGGGREQQRLFSPDIAESPRMWSSHPPNHEREANTKRLYVASILDSRSAWCLFADEKRLRRDATERFYKEANAKALESPAVEGPTSVVELDRQWERRRFDAAYRGAYVGRSAVLDEADVAVLMGKEPLDLRDACDRLYPPSLVNTLEAWKASEAQAAQLKALRDGVLTAPGGVIRFQGRDIARSQLAATIQTVEGERLTLRKRLADHDRDVRRTHLGMAAALGQGWEAHLRGTLRAIHFLEHAGADLDDAEGALNATFHVVIADGNVSNREMKLLLAACTAVHQSLVGIYGSAKVLSLPADALAALKVTSWEAELAEELKLGPPTREGLAENWLQVASTWIRAGGGGLDRAASASLDSLLAAEAHVARCWTEAVDPGVAPPPCTVPANYPTVREGVQRKRPALGWWDRFQVADGFFPGALRLGASAAVLTPGILLTWQLGEADVAVYNGLHIPVTVQLGDKMVPLLAGGHRTVSVGNDDALAVRATTEAGVEIEAFNADAGSPGVTYVYNVAQADSFAKTWFVYGEMRAPEPTPLGAERWWKPDLDHINDTPPTSIKSDGPTSRTVLASLAEYPPETMVGFYADQPTVVTSVATAHLRWDPPDQRDWQTWWALAKTSGIDVQAIVADRIGAEGLNVELGRARQDGGGPEVCVADTAAAAASPADPDLRYLAARCAEPPVPGAFAAALAQHPDHLWLRWGAAWESMYRADWAGAASLLETPPPSVRDDAALWRLRALRMLGAEADAQLAVVAKVRNADAMLAILRQELAPDTPLEDGPDRNRLMAGGRLNELRLLLDATAADRWWFACADGATEQDREQARAAGAPEPASPAYLCFVADGARTGNIDESAVTALVAAQPQVGPVVVAVLRAPPPQVAAVVEAPTGGEVDPRVRGWARLMGVMRLDAEAPPAWRLEARALLLPWERWYVAP